MVSIEAILDKLTGVRKQGAGWIAHCPSHRDRNPSFSISQVNGKLLFYCHAGCSYEQIKEALGTDEFQTEAAVYSYRDESKNVLFQSVRFFPKAFLTRKPTGEYSIKDVRKVIYNLPEVIEANPVLICEGEKDCDSASKLGFVATCNFGGAGKNKWKDEYSDFLKGKIVFIIADADVPGREHAERIAFSLMDKASSTRILEMPEAKDLTEWIEKGGTRDQLAELLSQAQPWTPGGPEDETQIELEFASSIKPERMLWQWENRIPLGKLTIFCGPPDTGKSSIVLDIVARGSRGADWPDCKNEHGPFGTLMLVSEDDLSDVVIPRLMSADANLEKVVFAQKATIKNGAKSYEREIALDTDLAAIEKILKKNKWIKLVVLDPLTGYVGKLKSNADEEMRPLLIKLKEVAERQKVSMLGIAHFNKKIEQSAIHRLAGAGALAAVPRAVWAFVKDQDDPEKLTRLMLNAKLNVVSEAKKAGLKYRIEERILQIAGHSCGLPRILWGEASSGDLEEILHRQVDPEKGKRKNCTDWLKALLVDGPMASKDIYSKAEVYGYSERTVKRSASDLQVTHIKRTSGWWMEIVGASEVL